MKTNETPRPLAERITQGTAFFDIEAVNARKPNCFLITDGTQDPLKGIAVACIHKEHGERIANAELIAEAFNVTHETGRTPRQLADDRAELIDALGETLQLARVKWGNLDKEVDATLSKHEALLTGRKG